jgi:hypothetical protein
MDNSEARARLGIEHRAKTNKATSTKQKTKKMSNTDPTKHDMTTQEGNIPVDNNPINTRENSISKEVISKWLLFISQNIMCNTMSVDTII